MEKILEVGGSNEIDPPSKTSKDSFLGIRSMERSC